MGAVDGSQNLLMSCLCHQYQVIFFICSYFGLKSVLSDGHTVVSAGFLGLHFLGSAFFQPLLTLRFVFVFKTEDASCRQHIEVPVCETSLLVCIF